MDVVYHFWLALVVSGIAVAWMDYRGNLDERGAIKLVLLGVLAGVFIDLDHFLWHRLVLGDWRTLVLCLKQPFICVTDVQSVWDGVLSIPGGRAFMVRNYFHVAMIGGLTGFTALLGRKFDGFDWWKPTLIVFLTTSTHLVL
ncbi:MAG: hypothetical protein MUP58_03005, partial [Candidatus Nanohaloarchaeota archaeon QJJ-9]|nr:hypothetical protein [Candidatus Nanohaloarchaeota archaeon QJJ-9]